MKKFSLLLLISISLSPVCLLAQEMDQEAQMAAWQGYMTPGEMHKVLAGAVGEWKTDITTWMDPGQPPTTAEGTAVCEAILDGRYFQFKHESTMMGMPFSGIETFGYDNARKKFFTSWIDNMGTGIMNLEGTYDEAAKTITYNGTSTDFQGKEIKVREVLKIIDNDNSVVEMYGDQGKGEVKMMEVKSTRKKL